MNAIERARNWGRRVVGSSNPLCVNCADANYIIADLLAEVERLAQFQDETQWLTRYEELRELCNKQDAKLSRYEGAVEVDGTAIGQVGLYPMRFDKLIRCDYPDELRGQTVTVLVMRKEGV